MNKTKNFVWDTLSLQSLKDMYVNQIKYTLIAERLNATYNQVVYAVSKLKKAQQLSVEFKPICKQLDTRDKILSMDKCSSSLIAEHLHLPITYVNRVRQSEAWRLGNHSQWGGRR